MRHATMLEIRSTYCILKKAFIALAIFLLPVSSATAQQEETYTLVLRGVSMEKALEELVKQSQLDLVYSNELIAGKRVFCSERDVNAESLLQCILKGSGIDFIRSSVGTYILIHAIQKPPLFGDLAGSIIDKETGAPLPYANILLADGSTATTANQDGFFSFKSLISGLQHVVVTYVGYETIMDSIWVGPGENSKINIGLVSSHNSVGPIVIDGLEQRLPSGALGRNSLKQADLMGISNLGTPDVIRGATKLAGIAVQQPLAGIQIQGGIGNEHVTMLDGVPVRDPVTLGRYLGAFSPLALNRMTIYKAGFGAQHGSHLTGIVKLDQDLDSVYPFSGSFMLDPVSLNGQLKGDIPLSNGREAIVMGAVRASNWDVYQDRGIQALLENWNGIDPFITRLWSRENVTPSTLVKYSQKPVVSFSDLHFGSRIKLSPFHNLRGSLYRAGNQIESDLIATNDLSPQASDLLVLTNDRYSWLNWAGQIKHSWLINAQSALSTQIKGSWHNSRYKYRAFKEFIENNPSSQLIEQTASIYQDTLNNVISSKEQNFIRELTFSTTLSHSFSPFHHMDLGLEATLSSAEFFFQNAFVNPAIDYKKSAANFAGFIQDKLVLNVYTSLEPSLRLTYLPTHNNVFAEPRLALRYDDIAPILGNYALRLAGGIYRQFINQFDLTSFGNTSAAPSILFWLPLDSSVSPPRAYHLALDALVTPGEHWSVGIETFVKWQQVLTVDYANLQQLPDAPAGSDGLPQHTFIGRAKGKTYGGSLNLAFNGKVFNISSGYDYIKATQQFPGRFNNQLIDVPWHSPHQLNINTKTKVSEGFSVEANWSSQWGRTWALRRAYYDFIAFRDLPVSLDPFQLNSPTDHKVPAYQRLDLGATLSIFSDRIKTDLQFFVTNILGRDNVYDNTLTPNEGAAFILPRTLPGRQFTLSVRVDY